MAGVAIGLDNSGWKKAALYRAAISIVLFILFLEFSARSKELLAFKMPFFGDLPGVGFLFQNKTKKTAKSETLVFITPKLINDLVGTR